MKKTKPEPKKIKKIKPLKVIEEVVKRAEKGGFDIYSYFNINDDETISDKEKLEFVYNNFEALEFRHDFIKALFPDYTTGTLYEWKVCPKCNKTIVIKNGDDERDKNINIEDFKFCPYCGGKVEYKAQKNMYYDVYLFRLRDIVIMESIDEVLQYFWERFMEQDENEKLAEKLDKQIEENVKKYNKK